jgi:tetratricopeptide (TPR) repeat protein
MGKSFLFFTIFFLFALRQASAQTFHLGLLSNEVAYSNFIKNKKLVVAKALNLPFTNYWLAFVAVERTEEQDLWSADKADRTEARIFVYDFAKKMMASKLTDEVNNKMGANKFYDPLFCGGLGSMDERDFKIEGSKIVLAQFYAAGTERSNCSSEIIFKNGKLVVQKYQKEDTSLETTTGRERKLRNQDALALLKVGKTNEAVLIWEELYGEWKNGAFPRAGAPDEVLNNLGFAYWKLKMYDEAEQILLECKQNFPARKMVYLNLGDLYRDMKNKQEAIAHYQEFLKLGATELQKKYVNAEIAKLK